MLSFLFKFGNIATIQLDLPSEVILHIIQFRCLIRIQSSEDNFLWPAGKSYDHEQKNEDSDKLDVAKLGLFADELKHWFHLDDNVDLVSNHFIFQGRSHYLWRKGTGFEDEKGGLVSNVLWNVI